MDTRFIITTTNNIEGCTIEKYIGAICSNVVIGTNLFSDFAASFTDFFGGRSDSYKRKLEIIYNEASKELKQKAQLYGANAIVGFKVDFDEVSGKDKSMFMVSASGTACKIECKKDNVPPQNEDISIVYQSDLDDEIYRRVLVAEINAGKNLKQKYVEYLISNPQKEVVEELVRRYIVDFKNEYNKENLPVIERLVSACNKEDVLPSIYDKLSASENKAVISLIEKCRLFDAKRILEICNNNPSLAISLLPAPSDYYSFSDLVLMKELYNKLSDVEDTGTVEAVKGGLLGKVQEKFICANGHKNDLESSFCKTCGINIKGLKAEEVEKLTDFQRRIEALEDLLNKE